MLKKGTFFEKNGTINVTSPYPKQFFGVLHQNQVLYNVHNRG